MKIKRLMVGKSNFGHFLFTLTVILLASCSQADITSNTPTAPAPTQTQSPQEFYQFKLQKQLGNGIVEAADWAPDAKTFVLATSLQTDIFDAQTLEKVATLDTGQWNKTIAYSPDSKSLAIGGEDGTIQIWDVDSKRLLHSLSPTGIRPYYGNNVSLSFTSDGKKLVSGFFETVYVWDLSSGDMLASFPDHPEDIVSVAISPDGKTVLSAGSLEIFVRDLVSGELVYPPIEVEENIISLFFSPDGRQFSSVHSRYLNDATYYGSAAFEGVVKNWDASTGQMLGQYVVDLRKRAIDTMDIDPDQDTMVLGSENEIQFWNNNTQQKSDYLSKHFGTLKSIAVSPKGDKLITVMDDFAEGSGLTQLWDLPGKQVAKTFDEYTSTPLTVAFSLDDRYVAIAGRNNTIQVIDTSSGKILRTLEGAGPLAFSPDGKTFAYAETPDRLTFTDVETGERLKIPAIGYLGIKVAAYSPNGKTLVIGGDSYGLQIHDAQTGKLIKELPDLGYMDADEILFSPDGKKIVLPGYPFKVLNAETGESLWEEEQDYSSHPAAFSPDGRYLAVAGLGAEGDTESIQVREADSNQIVLTLRTQQDSIGKLIFGPDGHSLYAIGDTLEVWDLWEEQPLANVKLFDEIPVDVSLAKDGQHLSLVDSSGGLQRWSFHPAPQLALQTQATPTLIPTMTATPVIQKVELAQVAEIGKGIGSQVDYSPDGTVATFVQNGTLRWFDASSMEELGSMELDTELDWYDSGVLISPNNKLAIVAGYYGGAQIVDLENREVIGQFFGGNGPAFGYSFSPDSQNIAYTLGDQTTGGPYHSIGLWNEATADTDPFESEGDYFPTLLPNRYHRMSAPAISPDGRLVAAGHSDKRVYVWDLKTGKTRFLLEGHGDNVNSVEFSPDGRMLASGSNDGTIRLWNPRNGKLIRVLTGFMDDIAYMYFSSDGESLHVWLADDQEYRVDLSSGEISPGVEPISTPDPFELMQYQEGFATNGSSVFSEVLFSPDGKTLATASGNILLWDVKSKKLLNYLDHPSGSLLLGMTFNADGSRIAATTDDDQVQVWDTRTGKNIFSRQSHFLNGMTVLYATSDTQWGPARGRSPVAEQGLAFSPQRNLLAFGNGNVIEIWDVDVSEKVAELAAPEGQYPTQLSFSADGERLYAIFNRNRMAQVWDVGAEKLVRQVDLPDVDPNAFSAVALQGPLFARNNGDGHEKGWVELWNLEQGDSIILPADSASNEPLVFSPDGRFLAGFGEQGTLSIWEISTGQPVYQTTVDFTGGLSISPDDKFLAIGSAGKAVLFDFAPVAKLAGQPQYQQPVPQVTPTPRILAWPTPTAIPTATKAPKSGSAANMLTAANASQLEQKDRFSEGSIEQLRWSPDGESVLISGALGVAEYEVDTQAGELFRGQVKELPGWTYNSLKLPDGRILSASAGDGRIIVEDVSSGRTLLDVEGDGQPAISPDGSLAVFMNADGLLEVWDIHTPALVAKLGNASHYPLKPVFSPDGSLVAAIQSQGSRYDDSIRIWNARIGEIVNALSGPDHNITGLAFSADGKSLVGAAGGSAWVWDLKPGAVPEKLELYPVEQNGNLNLYTQTVTSAALSPDNRTIAVGTSEHTLILFDRKTKKLLRELEGHAGSIRHLQFSPDGQYLISADQDGSIYLWDVSRGEQLAHLEEFGGRINGLLFRQDGNLTAWGEGTTWELEPSELNVLHTTQIGSGTILAASPAGDVLAVYEPYQVSLWDALSGEFLEKLEGEAEEPWVEYYWEGLAERRFYAASFNQDGSRLGTAGAGGVWYYDLENRKLQQQYPGSDAQKIALSPDGRYMLTSLYDQANPISLYDLTSGDVLFALDENSQGMNTFQSVFSPDGRWAGSLLHTWDGPYELKIFDTLTQKQTKSLSLGEEIPPLSLAFSPGGDLVAVGLGDGRILLIDMDKMEVVSTLAGHHGAVEHLVFSPDGSNLLSGSVDGTVRVWGLR